MIYILYVLLLLISAHKARSIDTAGQSAASITISNDSGISVKMPFLVVAITKHNSSQVELFAHAVIALLERPEWKEAGFSVIFEKRTDVPSKQHIQEQAAQFDLILFVSGLESGMIEWRLYDARQATMIKGGKGIIDVHTLFTKVERLADDMMAILTNQSPFFATRIAFCRYVSGDKSGNRQLCIVPPYITYKHPHYKDRCCVLVEGKYIFAPRWNKDLYSPLLFYSQSKNTNVQLIAANMNRQRRLVSNIPGLNFQPSFSADNKKVVYCGTHHGKTQLFMYTAATDVVASTLRPFIPREGNCISPYLCQNEDVIFCSDAGTKIPHICWYHAQTGLVEDITSDYSVCPHFNEKTHLLVYCKRIKGYTQIFMYDAATKKHEQMTFDATNKEECSWSPCGNYIAYSVEIGNVNRIALFNRVTREQCYVTGPDEQCIYPVWSGVYHVPLNII